MLGWIQHNTPSQNIVAKLWTTVRQKDLNYWYVYVMKSSIEQLQYKLPPITWHVATQYQYNDIVFCMSSEQISDLITNQYIKLAYPCQVRNCEQEIRHMFIFQLSNSLPCYKLDVDISDHSDYHYHRGSVCHWYVRYQSSNEPIHRDGFPIHSLITHNYEEFVSDIKKHDHIIVVGLIPNRL